MMKKILKYFTLFYSFFLVSIISAAVVFHVMNGGQKLNKYRDWITGYAQIPGKTYRFLSGRANIDDRYIENTNLKNGFTYYSDKSAINDDFLLISTFEPSDVNSQVIKLVEIRTNKEIYKWNINEKTFNGLIDINSTTRSLHPLLLKDKSLVFTNSNSDYITDKLIVSWLVKIDCNSRVEWVNKNHFHHTIEKEDENTIWACSRITSPLKNKHLLKNDNLITSGDAIYKIDSKTGKILFKKTIYSIIQENNLNEILFSGTIEDDLIHLNDIQPALYRTEYWEKGDLLISLRNKSTILLYRPSNNKILWYKSGPWLSQHDCDFYGDSKITLFGNDVVRYFDDYDFINETNNQYVFDFATNQIEKPYHQLFKKCQIKTKAEGRSDILPNGDIFVDESNSGRIIIGNKETPKALYVERIDKKNIKMFNWVRYIKREDFLKVR